MVSDITPEIALKPIIDRFPSQGFKDYHIGQGWWPIVLKLNDELAEIDPNYVVHQVKEKFGGLRYYFAASIPYEKGNIDPRINQMNQLVSQAEAEAWKTCEDCGAEITTEPSEYGLGGVSIGNWIRNICPECEAKALRLRAERDAQR